MHVVRDHGCCFGGEVDAEAFLQAGIALEGANRIGELLLRQGRPFPPFAAGGIDQLNVEEAAKPAGRIRHPTDRDLPLIAAFDPCFLDIGGAIDCRGQRLEPSPQIGLCPAIEHGGEIGGASQGNQDDDTHRDRGREIRIHA